MKFRFWRWKINKFVSKIRYLLDNKYKEDTDKYSKYLKQQSIDFKEFLKPDDISSTKGHMLQSVLNGFNMKPEEAEKIVNELLDKES